MSEKIVEITDLVCTCPAMPNQYEGRVDGKPFYFRARWGGWRLYVNDDVSGEGIDGAVVASGDEDRAGWWEPEEAEPFLRKQLESYARGGVPGD